VEDSNAYFSISSGDPGALPTDCWRAILAQDVTNGPTPVALQALYQAEQELVLQQIGSKPLSQLESLAAWRRAFVVLRWTRRSTAAPLKRFLRRLTKKGDIPSINLLVDIGIWSASAMDCPWRFLRDAPCREL